MEDRNTRSTPSAIFPNKGESIKVIHIKAFLSKVGSSKKLLRYVRFPFPSYTGAESFQQ